MAVVNQRIREARVQILGLKQRQLAAMLDVEPVTVYRWERANNPSVPRTDTLRALAKLTKKPVGWFFEETA